jgi:hypothetical protein
VTEQDQLLHPSQLLPQWAARCQDLNHRRGTTIFGT